MFNKFFFIFDKLIEHLFNKIHTSIVYHRDEGVTPSDKYNNNNNDNEIGWDRSEEEELREILS